MMSWLRKIARVCKCGHMRNSWMEAEADGPACTRWKGHGGQHRVSKRSITYWWGKEN